MAKLTTAHTDKTATVLGATGLIGGHILEQLQQDNTFQTIRVLSRRPVSFDHSKVRVVVLDFSDLDAFRKAIDGSDAVFCAVGTTQKQVGGDKEAYRKVDHDIPVHAAQFCAETGCPQFLLVSSVGADSGASGFYLQLKGEVEDKIGNLGVPSVAIFRPSMLLGDREEFRLGEKIGKVAMSTFSFLIPSKYKPIHAREVAKAMVEAAKEARTGVEVYEYGEMKGGFD